jgi:hypothetical protein
MMLVALAAWCAGLCCASVSAYAYTKLTTWQTFGEKFQLGYVVGYLDAVKLMKRKDQRVMLPSSGRAKYEQWRQSVNRFYENPMHADRPVPDAMMAVGEELRDSILRAYDERRQKRREAMRSGAAPSPSPGRAP